MSIRGRWPLAVTLLTLATVVACGDDTSTADQPVESPGSTSTSEPAPIPAESLDGSWVVTELTVDGAAADLVSEWPVTVSFDGDQISGVAACNSFGGTFTAGGAGAFAVENVDVTAMACEGPAMTIEATFLDALSRVDTYAMTGGLSLSGADGAVQITLGAALPIVDVSLTGVRWQLDTQITGDVAMHSSAMADAYVEFSDDGTVIGSTGCRPFEGTWSADGPLLAMPQLTAVGDVDGCSDDAITLDALVLAVIGDGASIAIEGTQLSLTAAGGDGLIYRSDGEGDTEAAPEPAPLTVNGPWSVDESVPDLAVGDVRLWVSNQRFDDDPVQITIDVDGTVVVDDSFEVEGQHNWFAFDISGIAPGQHRISATSDTGAELTDTLDVAADEPLFILVDYWYYPDDDHSRFFTLTTSQTPIAFD